MIGMPHDITPEFAYRWHGDLIAVDPSVTSPGVALFRHGVLIACDRVKIPDGVDELPPAARSHRVGTEIVSWWYENRGEGRHVIRTVIYEWPQVYRAAKSKGDPNDLIALASVGQSVATMLACINITNGDRPPEMLSPTPAEWIGQLPKTKKNPKESPRGKRILSRLEPGELALVPSQHDAIDGLGLGLKALGRLEVAHVFAGATR